LFTAVTDVCPVAKLSRAFVLDGKQITHLREGGGGGKKKFYWMTLPNMLVVDDYVSIPRWRNAAKADL